MIYQRALTSQVRCVVKSHVQYTYIVSNCADFYGHTLSVICKNGDIFFKNTYRVAHGIRTLFKDMPLTSATSKNMIAGMDRLAMELSFNHQKIFVVYGILGLLT